MPKNKQGRVYEDPQPDELWEVQIRRDGRWFNCKVWTESDRGRNGWIVRPEHAPRLMEHIIKRHIQFISRVQ